MNENRSSAYYDAKASVARVKELKLMFLGDFFKEKEKSEIPKFYQGGEFELVDMTRYQEAVINREEGVCYAKIIWSNQLGIYEWITVEASTGRILTQQTFGGVKFGSSHQADEIIKVKHLKYVTNERAQAFNNKYK